MQKLLVLQLPVAVFVSAHDNSLSYLLGGTIHIDEVKEVLKLFGIDLATAVLVDFSEEV